MDDRSLYEQLLGLKSPWKVTSVALDMPKERVDVFVEHERGAPFACPE